VTLTFLDGTSAELETQVSGAQKWQGDVLDELVQRSGNTFEESRSREQPPA
jgi:hypothetical protein